MYRLLFSMLATVGKPFGGIPPRRTLHWLAKRAYGDAPPDDEGFQWHWDRWGNRLLLHPHYMVDYQIIAFGAFESRLHRFIDRHIKPGMVCFDVGAHIGSVTLHLARRVGDEGAVHCFEPIQHNFDRIVNHVAVNQLEGVVSTHRLALSNETGTQTISYANSNFSNQGMASLVISEHPDVFRECSIEVMTLDEFVQRNEVERIDFIKVDIQGAEPLFVEGGHDTLARLRPTLYVEVSPPHLEASGSSSRSLLRALQELGYVIFELKRNGQRLRRISPETVPEDYDSPGVWAVPKESVNRTSPR